MIVTRPLRQVTALVVMAVTVGVGSASGATVASPSLKGGQRIVFRAGVLSVGSTVACMSHAVRVVARVPRLGQAAGVIGDGLKGSATLRLTTHADGSVVARCL
jgi:hypothetical protein